MVPILTSFIPLFISLDSPFKRAIFVVSLSPVGERVGCALSVGSLGQGLSVACGMAYAGKHFDKVSSKIYGTIRIQQKLCSSLENPNRIITITNLFV